MGCDVEGGEEKAGAEGRGKKRDGKRTSPFMDPRHVRALHCRVAV